MKTGRRKIYWDTTVWLAWLNDERDKWPSSIVTGIQEVVFEVEMNEAILFTSAVTRGEIYLGRLTADKKALYAKLMRRSNFQEINADPRVMDRVSAIREYHDARGQKIKTPDATHLASAILYRADEFLTMDGLQANGSKHRKLLALTGNVGGYDLKIVHPYPRQTPPAELIGVPRGPLFEGIKDQNEAGANKNEQPAGKPEKSDKLQADPAHPAPVQGSDSGRPEGEATTEPDKREQKKAKPAEEGGLGESSS